MSVKLASKQNAASKQVNAWEGWVRPTDWLPMASQTAEENKIQILVAVFDADYQSFAFNATVNTGTWQIDWGDGTVSTAITSVTTSEHTYTYASLTSPVTSDGYKTALITITPSSTNYFTALTITEPTGLYTNMVYNTLDILISMPQMTGVAASTIQYTSTTVTKPLLERLWFLSGTISNIYSLIYNATRLKCISPLKVNAGSSALTQAFFGCSSLEYCPDITVVGSTSSITSASYMFNNCFNMSKFPKKMDLPGVTDFTSMFSGCIFMEETPIINYTPSIVTAISGMFQNCYELKKINFDLNFPNVTAMASMFQSCFSLTTIPNITSGTALTTIANMFQNCYRLKVAPAISYTSNVTTMASLFNNCYQLRVGHNYDTWKCTALNAMYSNCYNLVSIPTSYILSAVTTTGLTSAFTSCNSLISITTATGPAATITSLASVFPVNGCNLAKLSIPGLKFSFSIANNKFNATELNNVYTNLPTATGQTITVTGNPGTATDNPAIATAKGWTVTG